MKELLRRCSNGAFRSLVEFQGLQLREYWTHYMSNLGTYNIVPLDFRLRI
jgi:hypothetical protein